MTRRVCPDCEGDADRFPRCPTCGGSGIVKREPFDPSGCLAAAVAIVLTALFLIHLWRAFA